MSDGAAAGRSGQQLLARERFIWWFRLAAVGFVVVQTIQSPGDDPALSWSVAAALAGSVVATGVSLAGSPSAGRVRLVGYVAMATDALVVLSVLANNRTDPGEPVYLVGVLAMLEAAIRWRRHGGIIAGLVAGPAAGAWTLVVSERTTGDPAVDYASMRAGVIIGLGVFLGTMLRRLTEQHETLQGILDTTRDLIVALDDRGHILSINAASAHVLGYPPEEMVGHRYWDFFHPDDVQPATDRRLALPDAPVVFERRAVCRDGSVRWLELNAVGIPASGTIHVSARDITERREAQVRIEESEQRFRSLFEHNSDAVYALDLHGRFTMVNPAGERITGYSTAEIIGSHYVGMVAPDELAATDDRFDRAVGGEALTYETAVLDRQGRRIELDVTNVPIVVDGRVVGVFGIAKDVTERRRLERQLGHQATHDALTGLPNRARLESALAEAAVSGEARSLLFIDLDRFKLVNDSLGHRSGDELLCAAVERLRGNVRGDDLLARWAGDEFCVLLAPGTGEGVALQVADRLRAVLAEPFTVGARQVRLSASIGLASSRAGDAERLVQVADLAMYEAKRAGRDRVSVYSADTAPALTQLDLEADLAAALDAHEVEVHYQPIVETTTGVVRGVEALVRWPSMDGGVRQPADFVPAAEESGLIRVLTRHVLRDACAALARWDRAGAAADDLQAWVNTSTVDLESPSFAADVAEVLTAAGLSPSRLVLEVTETMLMRDVAQVDATIAELRDLGVVLAIDDFGTGYASLNQLHRFDVAACKIDRQFVCQAPERAPDSVILRALVEVGTAFGVPVVAEGIERPEELAAVAATGCPLAQGFLLGMPSPAALLDDVLVAGRVPLPELADLGGGGAVPSRR